MFIRITCALLLEPHLGRVGVEPFRPVSEVFAIQCLFQGGRRDYADVRPGASNPLDVQAIVGAPHQNPPTALRPDPSGGHAEQLAGLMPPGPPRRPRRSHGAKNLPGQSLPVRGMIDRKIRCLSPTAVHAIGARHLDSSAAGIRRRVRRQPPHCDRCAPSYSLSRSPPCRNLLRTLGGYLHNHRAPPPTDHNV